VPWLTALDFASSNIGFSRDEALAPLAGSIEFGSSLAGRVSGRLRPAGPL